MVISFPGEASTAFFSLAGAFLDLLLRGLTLRGRGLAEWLPRSQVVQGIPMALRAWHHNGRGVTR